MPADALHGPLEALLALPLLVASACGSGVPRPAYAAQGTAALLEAGYPAPPGRVEFIPDRPSSGAVWLDGEWSWTGSKWSWVRGRWVLPPMGARFAPWTTTRDERGQVYFAPGVWKDGDDHLVSAPTPLAYGRTSVGGVVSPGGTDEPAGLAPRGVANGDE